MPQTCAIVGVGGLGAPAAALLGALGEFDLRLVDDDHVDLSNLPRQPLYGREDLGKNKARTAARHLQAMRSSGAIEVREERLTAANATTLLEGVAVVIDGTDSLPAKRFLNQWCCGTRTPLVHAGALGWDGQLMTIVPGQSACLACLFDDLGDDREVLNCEQEGILGPVVGAIGLAAAREALAVLRGEIPSLAGRFAILDGRTLLWRSLATKRRPECPACGQLA
jgi:molybdopterin/thiamine biosynthesis adenylyltransferase